jgi:hypothetical protein
MRIAKITDKKTSTFFLVKIISFHNEHGIYGNVDNAIIQTQTGPRQKAPCRLTSDEE